MIIVVIKIKNLSKSYKNGTKAVDSLTLEVGQGEIYGFIGHNGAGKTTTIKCLAGILEFSEGTIIIDSKSLKDSPVKCKQVMSYIPDNPDLYDYLTGIAYLNFVSDIYEVSKKDREEQIKKYSNIFELTQNLGDLVGSYSHGMKQKLSIIAALIHKPKVLILDEPFVGLDPKASHSLKEIMKELCESGSAIFFSTHVLEVAEKICTKIGIIKQGKLIVSGETSKIIGEKSLENIFLELIASE